MLCRALPSKPHHKHGRPRPTSGQPNPVRWSQQVSHPERIDDDVVIFPQATIPPALQPSAEALDSRRLLSTGGTVAPPPTEFLVVAVPAKDGSGVLDPLVIPIPTGTSSPAPVVLFDGMHTDGFLLNLTPSGGSSLITVTGPIGGGGSLGTDTLGGPQLINGPITWTPSNPSGNPLSGSIDLGGGQTISIDLPGSSPGSDGPDIPEDPDPNDGVYPNNNVPDISEGPQFTFTWDEEPDPTYQDSTGMMAVQVMNTIVQMANTGSGSSADPGSGGMSGNYPPGTFGPSNDDPGWYPSNLAGGSTGQSSSSAPTGSIPGPSSLSNLTLGLSDQILGLFGR